MPYPEAVGAVLMLLESQSFQRCAQPLPHCVLRDLHTVAPQKELKIRPGIWPDFVIKLQTLRLPGHTSDV